MSHPKIVYFIKLQSGIHFEFGYKSGTVFLIFKINYTNSKIGSFKSEKNAGVVSFIRFLEDLLLLQN